MKIVHFYELAVYKIVVEFSNQSEMTFRKPLGNMAIYKQFMY